MMFGLNDISIVTIALNVPGPLAAMKLREAGAKVTKLEPVSGDPLERYCPGWYRELHEGITVERVDLKSGDGSARIRDLLATADLFLASQRPAALGRLGLDADTLLGATGGLNHLRWLNIVGELANPGIPGHDLTYLAKAGLVGNEIPRTVFADVLAGERAFSTALLLLRQPGGSRAQIGLYDTLAPAIAARRHGLTGPGTMLGGASPAYGVYEAREGRIAVAALEPHFHARLYEELRVPAGAALAGVFRSRTATEWEQWASERDLPITAAVE